MQRLNPCEQQMFLPHDGSGGALSWELRDGFVPARLVVRPFLSGCSPRSYRDAGFQYESEQDGGLLAWLPNVRGPKFIADTNGRYQDEPLRSLKSAREHDGRAAEILSPQGTFEFELTCRCGSIRARNITSSRSAANSVAGTCWQLQVSVIRCWTLLKHRHARRIWYAHLALIMPDHVHLILTFPDVGKRVQTIMSKWKKWTAKSLKIDWQRDFFEHRLRKEESLREKADYILANPVRAGLVKKIEDWPYTFIADPW